MGIARIFCMLLVSWVSFAILNSSLALPMPDVQLDQDVAEFQPAPAASAQVVMNDGDPRTHKLDLAIESAEVVDLSAQPFYGAMLNTFKHGLVLFQEGNARWSNFKVQMLGGPVCCGMSAGVNF